MFRNYQNDGCSLRKNIDFIVSFSIIFGTLSFPVQTHGAGNVTIGIFSASVVVATSITYIIFLC